ncbi:T-cell surface antigen CD2-like [Lepisosteus oculatus]|uniref:T-cell surface antigen CD2-like n=1 Tax=Lepisosteus oculatus TaxID=7918 RepID=UPI0035F518C5
MDRAWPLLAFSFLFLPGSRASPNLYVATGSTVYLTADNGTQLNFHEFDWYMKTFRVAKLRNSTVHYYWRQGEIFLNGTLRLDNVSKNDTGEITAKLFDTNGKNILQITYNLNVLDPVSQPVVEYMKASNGQSEFHCLVKSGDDPLYSWSFDVKPLDSTVFFHIIENHKLRLSCYSGRVTCTVSNYVSRRYSEPLPFTCADEESMQVTGLGWCIGIGIMFFVCSSVVMFLLYSRKQKTPTVRFRQKNIPNQENQDEADVTYSELKIIKQQK